MDAERKIGARDALILLGILLLAAALRFEGLANKGLTHFDEGAYALTAEAIASGRGADAWYPHQTWLAPPVFYGCAAAAIRLGVPPLKAPLYVAALFGVLGVAALWELARRSGDLRIAHLAALVLALSPHHIAFSRVGLTDTAFLFWFLAALIAILRAEARGTLLAAGLAGVLVGIAWNTKYHGWLALVIWGCASVATQRRTDGAARRAALLRLLSGSCVAALLYLPWYLHVASEPGGYAALVEQHRSFLKPRPHNILVQLDSAAWFARESGWLLPLLGFALAAPLLRRRPHALAFAALILLSRGRPEWCLPLLIVGGLLGLRAAWGGSFSGSLVFAFLSAFTLLTPLYHPYARLLLPFVAALPLGATLLARDRRPSRLAPSFLAAALLLGVVALGSDLGTALPKRPEPAGFDPAARALIDVLPKDAPIDVLGEPAVALSLRLQGHEVRCVNSVAEALAGRGVGSKLWLLCGSYSRRRGELARQRERWPQAFVLRGRADAQTGSVRWLDDHEPARLLTRGGVPADKTYELRLFEVVIPPR